MVDQTQLKKLTMIPEPGLDIGKRPLERSGKDESFLMFSVKI